MKDKKVDKVSDVLAALSMVAIGIFALMGSVIVFLLLAWMIVALYSMIISTLGGA